MNENESADETHFQMNEWFLTKTRHRGKRQLGNGLFYARRIRQCWSVLTLKLKEAC